MVRNEGEEEVREGCQPSDYWCSARFGFQNSCCIIESDGLSVNLRNFVSVLGRGIGIGGRDRGSRSLAVFSSPADSTKLSRFRSKLEEAETLADDG